MNGTLTSSWSTDTSVVFYLDGGQLYNFTVIARNSDDRSLAQSQSGSSPELGK